MFARHARDWRVVQGLHISAPTVAKVPVLVINELKIREREFLLYHLRELSLNRFGPLPYEDDEFVDIPSHPSSGHLGVVAFELGSFACCLGAEVFLGPYLSVQVRVVDERQAVVSRFFRLFGGKLLLADAEEGLVLRIIPEDSDLRHRFVQGSHCLHLLLYLVF